MTSNNALTKREHYKNLGELLAANKKRIAAVLPKHVGLDPERMLKLALTSIQKNPTLLEATPTSFLAAFMQSAQLGLEPDGLLGQAYLIPYRNKKKGVTEINFQIGYQGLMELARRSDRIANIIPRIVHEHDEFEYHFGLEKDHLKHIPTEKPDPGKPTHVYCIVRLKDGSVQYEVWPAAKVEAHRKRHSRASSEGPWVTHWEQMAMKTLIIQVLKYCPKSVELSKAIALEELAAAGVPQDLEGIIDVTPEINGNGEEKSSLDALVDKETGEVIDEEPDPELEAKAEGQKKALEEAEKKEEKPKRGRPKKEQKDSVPNKSELNFD